MSSQECEMGKLNPVNQSMAALFSPESERLRADAKTAGAGQSAHASKRPGIPGVDKPAESGKPGDSLGNPSSPGYDNIWHRKDPEKASAPQEEQPPKNDGSYVRVKEVTKKFVRIQAGWERLLMAQKKICEKARNLFVKQDAPTKYAGNSTSKLLAEVSSGKPIGMIVDLDAQKYLEEQAQKQREEKEKKKAA